MDKDDILKTNDTLPDNYFNSIEDRVIRKYHKRQAIRLVRNLSCCLVGIAVVVSAGIYSLQDSSKDIALTEQKVQMLKDTLKNADAFTIESTEEIIAQAEKPVVTEENIVKASYKTTRPKQSQANTLRFTEEELDFLQNYLNEDNYELVYNYFVQ